MNPPFTRSPLWILPALFALMPSHAQQAGGEAAVRTLKPVVVTATRTERALDETPIRTEVVTREEIERTHARTLKQALENVPGLQMREVLGKSGYELSLQGLSSDQVLVLIDGLPITASTSSTVDLSQYLLSDVERIEVVKGASSAQYGSSAMGGVINVITRRPQQGFGGSATVDIGSYGKQNDSGRSTGVNNRHGAFSLAGGGETWRLSLSGDSVDDDGFAKDPSGWPRQGDASLRQQLSARATWLPRRGAEFWVEGSRYSEEDVQRYNFFAPPLFVPQRKTEDITRNRLSGGADWRFDNGLRAQVKGVDERYDTVSKGFSNNFLATDRRAEIQTQHVSTQFDLPAWNRQLWMFGTDWHRETLDQTSNGTSELGVLGSARRTNTEFFVQNDIIFNDTWEVVLGLRAQRDSDFGGHSAPKVSVKANLLDSGGWKGALRASVGQGYRVPNLKERHYLFDHSALGYMVVGNPRLRPESSTSLQFGGTLSLHDELTVELNLFRNRLKDLIQTDLVNFTTVNGIAIYSYSNVTRARTSGFEAAANWRPTAALRLNAAYTRTDTRDLTSGLELTRRPRDIVRVGADWTFIPSTTLTARVRHQSDELADTLTRGRSPAWTQLDLSVNHAVSRQLTLFAGVNNATGEQRDFSNPSDFGPVAGRFVYVGARYAFGNTVN